MGFTIVEGERGACYGYRVLAKSLPLPANGKPAVVTIRFYPESVKWEPATKPLLELHPSAMLAPDGIVKLGERALFHSDAYPGVRDVVVEVKVDGQVVYSDKAKYEDAERSGIRRCRNGWYVDEIDTRRAAGAQ